MTYQSHTGQMKNTAAPMSRLSCAACIAATMPAPIDAIVPIVIRMYPRASNAHLHRTVNTSGSSQGSGESSGEDCAGLARGPKGSRVAPCDPKAHAASVGQDRRSAIRIPVTDH